MTLRPDGAGTAARLLRGVRRLPWLGPLALLVLVTVVSVVLWGDPAPRGGAGDGWVGPVGMQPETPVGEYLMQARARLAGLAGTAPVYALVGFTGYLPPGSVAPLLPGASTAMVLTRVPVADDQAELVRLLATRLPDDVLAGMDATARRKDSEAARYGKLLAATGDPERRTMYAAAQRLAWTEAGAYRAHCACVYAAVVRAAPPSLVAVAATPGVRFVDPATQVRQLDGTVFRPPLPDEGRSGEGR